MLAERARLTEARLHELNREPVRTRAQPGFAHVLHLLEETAFAMTEDLGAWNLCHRPLELPA